MLLYGIEFSQQLQLKEGFVIVQGGRIWYKIVGKGKGIPLLLIHGGPGSRSCESIPEYSLLADQRPVIFYDQLGSGNSDRPTDTTLWRLERFVDEIDSLRKALNLKELHILGHSWGGTVLVEYLLTKKPTGVRSVIFNSPLLSTKVWINDANILVSRLPRNIRDTIKKYEALKQYTAWPYLAATDSFYARYLSVKQWPMVVPSACKGAREGNLQVYNYMWGATEFSATGKLVDFDRTNRLGEISEPVLFISGRFDEARPETMAKFQKMVPHSKLQIIENAGHLTAIDQPLQFTTAVRTFLNSGEENR